MKRARATVCLLLVSALGCATGVEPTLEQPVEVGGTNTGGSDTGGSDSGSAGVDGGGRAGAGGTASATAGVGGALSGGAGVGGAIAGASGSAGASGAASAGAGGVAGNGGAAGSAGNAGAGGMPSTVKPTSLSVNATKNATAKQAPGGGGTPYDDACPAGQVLIGFDGSVGSDQTYLRSVAGVCAKLALGSAAPYAVTTSQAGTLPVRMVAQSTAQSALCPANQVVVGFAGTSGGYVDSLKFRCAPLSVGGQAPNFKLSIGTASDSGSIGGPAGGSAFTAISCSAGQVAVSQQVNAGGAIDGFGIACSVVSLVVQ